MIKQVVPECNHKMSSTLGHKKVVYKQYSRINTCGILEIYVTSVFK